MGTVLLQDRVNPGETTKQLYQQMPIEMFGEHKQGTIINTTAGVSRDYPESVDGVLTEVGAYDSSYAIKKTLWKKNHR